jgi:hypothetical protein
MKTPFLQSHQPFSIVYLLTFFHFQSCHKSTSFQLLSPQSSTKSPTSIQQRYSSPLSQLSLSSSSPSKNNNSSNNYSDSNNEDLSNLATSRFPTSPEDQVRQASIAIALANKDNKTRHSIRLLLPIIGATELDDWPGGARQMMDAASPLMNDVMQLLYRRKNNYDNYDDNNKLVIQESVIDESDGVRAMFTQGKDPKDDACVVLLPSADTVTKLQQLDKEVGLKRNLLVVNSQWRRKTDFGVDIGRQFTSFFGNGNNGSKNEKIEFIEAFEPTFHCTNVMVEGDIVRILRTYPGPWRVYLRVVAEDDMTNIDWVEIGTKDVILTKNDDWERNAKESNGDYDGGRLFDYGIPTYKEIEKMIVSREGYIPKSLSERAASAFTFIKDSL